jgi:hypothetical protein
MEQGYRDPFTYRSLPLLPSMSLINHVLNVENLVHNRMNKELHQYLLELSEGKDPRKCKWYQNIVDK